MSAGNATNNELRAVFDCIKTVTTDIWLVYEGAQITGMPTVGNKLDRNITKAILRCSKLGNNNVGLIIEDSYPTEEHSNKRLVGDVDDGWLDSLNVEGYTRPSNASNRCEKRSESIYQSS